jgi:hypothetical protein
MNTILPLIRVATMENCFSRKKRRIAAPQMGDTEIAAPQMRATEIAVPKMVQIVSRYNGNPFWNQQKREYGRRVPRSAGWSGANAIIEELYKCFNERDTENETREDCERWQKSLNNALACVRLSKWHLPSLN